MLGGTFFTAVSQILLKQSSNIKYENKIREYLNFRVILSYGMFFLILLLNTWCYTKVEMRYGPVIDTAAYVFVLLLSRLILKEKITKGKILGNLIIITGILIYTQKPVYPEKLPVYGNFPLYKKSAWDSCSHGTFYICNIQSVIFCLCRLPWNRRCTSFLKQISQSYSCTCRPSFC